MLHYSNSSYPQHISGSLGRGGRLPIVPDFNLSDSEDQTPLELALCTGQISIAQRLLEAGASIEQQTTNGLTLLHKAVRRGDSESSLFLLDHGADINSMYVSLVFIFIFIDNVESFTFTFGFKSFYI